MECHNSHHWKLLCISVPLPLRRRVHFDRENPFMLVLSSSVWKTVCLPAWLATFCCLLQKHYVVVKWLVWGSSNEFVNQGKLTPPPDWCLLQDVIRCTLQCTRIVDVGARFLIWISFLIEQWWIRKDGDSETWHIMSYLPLLLARMTHCSTPEAPFWRRMPPNTRYSLAHPCLEPYRPHRMGVHRT